MCNTQHRATAWPPACGEGSTFGRRRNPPRWLHRRPRPRPSLRPTLNGKPSQPPGPGGPHAPGYPAGAVADGSINVYRSVDPALGPPYLGAGRMPHNNGSLLCACSLLRGRRGRPPARADPAADAAPAGPKTGPPPREPGSGGAPAWLSRPPGGAARRRGRTRGGRPPGEPPSPAGGPGGSGSCRMRQHHTRPAPPTRSAGCPGGVSGPHGGSPSPSTR